MLLERLTNEDGLTDAERTVARHALEHPDETRHLTTAQLATATATSKATVVRLVKKCGCTSYREFCETLWSETLELRRVDALMSEEPVRPDSGYEEILQTVSSMYAACASRESASLDKPTVYRAVNHILHARRVDVFGMGITHALAELAAFEFSTIGIPCSAQSGLNRHAIQADPDPRGTVAIVLSFTGFNALALEIARVYRERGCYVLGIGGTEAPDLEGACSDYLRKHDPRYVLALESVTSFHAMSYIVDVLYLLMLVRRYDAAVGSALRARKGEVSAHPELARIYAEIFDRASADGAR